MTGRFSVEVVTLDDSGTTVLALAGELDHDTAEPLRQALSAAIDAASGARLLVDCARLRFCDSTGLNVLLRARLAAEEAHGSVELVALRDQMSRMFRLTGADGVFRIHRDLAGALGGGPVGASAGAEHAKAAGQPSGGSGHGGVGHEETAGASGAGSRLSRPGGPSAAMREGAVSDGPVASTGDGPGSGGTR
ncbi:STAS domain-containing protein [Streptomyces sp. BI20]|uniref:STAS domain-containing protein n=1 Tax=Streptomyces sp. BI20 TaxID=3403460 RepID=UPI003C70C2B2